MSLSYLLQKVGINNAESVVVKASDGSSCAISLETAFREDVIIAYQKDGQPLSEVLRLVIPGANGDMWVAQITHIMLIAPPYAAHSPSPSPTPQQMPTTSITYGAAENQWKREFTCCSSGGSECIREWSEWFGFELVSGICLFNCGCSCRSGNGYGGLLVLQATGKS